MVSKKMNPQVEKIIKELTERQKKLLKQKFNVDFDGDLDFDLSSSKFQFSEDKIEEFERKIYEILKKRVTTV